MRTPARSLVAALVLLALPLARCGGGTPPPTSPDLVEIRTTALPAATAGVVYDATIDATGPHAPLSFHLVAGQWPPGLALDAASGRVTGWPRRTGRFGVTVEVRDGADPAAARDSTFASARRAFTLEVARGPLTLLPLPLDLAQFAAPYVHHFAAAGGDAPYTFELADADLPAGLVLADDGTLAGVPRGAARPYAPRVRVTDARGATAERAFDLVVVVLPLGIAADPWPDAARGFPFSAGADVRPGGGGGPYAWSVVASPDGLPPGLALDAVTGRIDGTATDEGTFAFRLEVRDLAGQVAARDVTMRVNPGPVLTAVTPPTPPKSGGPVTLVGAGFQPGMTAAFAGGVPVATAWIDATRATVVPPDLGLSGPVEVRVTNPDGGGYARPGAFRYPFTTVTFAAEGVKGAPAALGTNRGLAVGDLDGDGRDEVVVVGSTGIQVIADRGATYGNAWVTTPVRTSGSYNDVRLADVDADGDLDLVTARSSSTETIEVYRNDGAGGFPSTASTSMTYPKPASHFPSSLAVGDVNGDGVVDLVLTSGGGGQGTLWVFRGLGNGQWTLVHTAAGTLHDGTHGCFAPNMVALGDLDGDRRDDFVVVDAFPSACANGVACPATAGTANAFPGHERLVAWTAAAGPTGAPVAWKPAFVSGSFGRLDGDNLGVAVYDHDGDGRLDAAVCGGYQDLRGMGVAFLTGDGEGNLVERFTRPTAYDRRYAASLDADLDGCGDLVVVGGDGRAGSFGAAGYSVAEVYLGGTDGVPILAWRTGPELSASLPGANPGHVAVGDFDGDGRPDFAVEQSFHTKERFSNDQGDGTVEGVAIYLNRSH
ncbi:MAG: VCBS repeat-containing protein [Planctomycetia bacterium]|nr:VCBS repeat-containing protein [Planctomycetia bacterium]